MSAEHRGTSWPAPRDQLITARAFLKECGQANSPTLLLPDKDTDGLSSGAIVYATLLHLGLDPSLIAVHFAAKGSNIHSPTERARMTEAMQNACFVIVTDQGSRGGPPIVEDADARTLVIDHHWSVEFPDGAVVCSAAQCPPVATSSTLAYILCRPLVESQASENSDHEDDGKAENLKERLEWLCALGTMGDLGTSFKWEAPFPDIHVCLKKWTKKALGEAVGLLNAPRRSAEYDVQTAWRILLSSSSPKDIISAPPGSSESKSRDVQRLHDARAEVREETNRCARRPPAFSGDGRVALIRISSTAQVHPLIATRWASSLKGARLEVVMCANDGYTPGMTNFACRVAKSGAKNGQDVDETDIISILKEYADRVPGLKEAMGDDFARGHKEASGGIVRTEQFERLWETMARAERGEGGPPQKKRKTDGKSVTRQKNTLEGWLEKHRSCTYS